MLGREGALFCQVCDYTHMHAHTHENIHTKITTHIQVTQINEYMSMTIYLLTGSVQVCTHNKIHDYAHTSNMYMSNLYISPIKSKFVSTSRINVNPFASVLLHCTSH